MLFRGYQVLETKLVADRIIIKAPNWIGDMIMATPLISVLADALPQARIDLLASSWVADILQHHPRIHHIYCTDRPPVLDSVTGRVRFWKELRREKYDLGIVLPNSFKSAGQLYLTGARKRIGYSTDARGFFLTRSLPVDRAANELLHQSVYYLKILTLLGIGIPSPVPPSKIYLTEPEKEWGDKYIKKLKKGSDHPVIAIAPGSSKPERCWHVDRMILLARKLVEECKADIVLLGSSRERPLLERIRDGIGERVIIGDRFSIRQVAAVIRASSLLIGNNSGLIHLAAAVGARLVAIFGPGSPLVTSPYPANHPYQTIIYHPTDCSPCRERFFRECRPSESNKPVCLESIEVKEVFEAARKQLKP
ncbi:MAG: lipopolysaccharide heptosyltransferase II [bacterium]